MPVPLWLLETLEELLDDDFKTFKWYLSMNVLDGCKPIAKSYLEKARRTDTVDRVIASYGEASAVSITVEILKKMNVNDAAEKLKNRCAGAVNEGNTAATSTSSSTSAPPAAPATISAQQGSVIIAPTITGGTSGALNITINKA